MECKKCERELRIETAQEVDEYGNKLQKVKIYYCINPSCNTLPIIIKPLTKIIVNSENLELI